MKYFSTKKVTNSFYFQKKSRETNTSSDQGTTRDRWILSDIFLLRTADFANCFMIAGFKNVFYL